MKTLVFALMLETLVNNSVDSVTQYGVFENIDHCIYFSQSLTRQGFSTNAAKLDYRVPFKAYCIPMFVDKENTVIFKR